LVYDSIKNYKLYIQNEKFEKAFEYILNYSGQEPGTYEVCDGVRALVQDRNTEPAEKRRYENHKRYLDIQYLREGEESVGVTLCGEFKAETPYNGEKDTTYFEGQGKDICLMKMRPGYFVLLYPQDYHMPLIGDGSRVKKIVMKVLLDE
jgi:YhcH/YjgK/YiaL family protein